MGKLGQLLVARGWITVQQLTRALQTQNSVGGRVGTCLLEMEVLGEDLLARSLSEQLGVPAAVIEDLRGIPEEVLRLIPEKLARRCRAIPFRVAGGRLDIAMQDPRNLVCQDEIAFACGRRVKVHVLHELRIYEALQRYYREEYPSRYSLLLDRLNRARYMWGAKDGGPRPPPGTPEAQAAQRAAAAPPQSKTPAPGRAGGATGAFAANPYSAEIRAEVLSALPAEDLLAETPRFQPPPLPEPSFPPLPRRRSLFRSRGTAASAPPPAAAGEVPRETPATGPGGAPELTAMPALQTGAGAGGANAAPGGAQLLPPLEELDLRGEPPRRQREQRQDEAAAAAALASPAAGAMHAGPEPAGAADEAQAPAGAADAGAAVAARASAGAMAAAPVAGAATPDAGPAGTIPGLDLEATLALGPSAAGRARGPAAGSAPREAAAPLGAAEPRREPGAVPHDKVAITEEERAELGLAEAPPAAPAESPREAPATLKEVERALAATTDSEEVGRLLLGFLAQSFRRVALFQASRDQVTAWMASGDGIDQEAFGRYAVSFKQPSVFLNLRQGSGIHIGPLPPMATHRELALCWGGGLPRDCVVLPVRLRDRLVTVVYMDGGSRGLGGIDLEQMHRLTAATAAAFERCILSKKRGYAQS